MMPYPTSTVACLIKPGDRISVATIYGHHHLTVTATETTPAGTIRLSGTNDAGYADTLFLHPAAPVRKARK